MNKFLLVTVLCAAAAHAATKPKTTTAETSRGGFGIGVHDHHPQVLDVSHGGSGWGSGGAGAGGAGGGWGGVSSGWGNETPALADIVALVLNLLVLAAFGGLVYLLLSPLLSGGGHDEGWGRSSNTPYYDAVKDGGLLSRVLNSIDYVDTTFAIMKISGDGCRKRVACEMERAATRNKVFGYATSFFRNRMRSMDLYQEAVLSGDKQQDCVQQYPDCTYTLVDKVGKWVGN